MATTAENKANQLEAIVKQDETILIDLTPVQQQVVKMLGKTNDEITAVAKSVFQSRIKSMLKAYKDSAKGELSKMYDETSRRGAKFEQSKDEWLDSQMTAVNQLFNKLV